MTPEMRPSRRVLRTFAVLGVAAGSLVASVTISASEPVEEPTSTGEVISGSSVDGGAVATQSAARTGITTSTDEPHDPTPPPSSFEEQVLHLVNLERLIRGLQPLTLDERLIAASRAHSVHQSEAGSIFHVSPDGTTPGDRITATGYVFRAWAENVAAGYSSPETVVLAWMNSPGHCRNILAPRYVHLGVGYHQTDDGYRHWWTQKFAQPMGTPDPPGTYDPDWC